MSTPSISTIRRSKIVRRSKGFTITEILIAATLSMVFAAMISQVLVSGVRNTGDTLARIEADTRAREVFRTVTASLRGAQPPGYCLDPLGNTVLDACLVVGPNPSLAPLLVANPDEIVFFAYTKGQGKGIRSAPDRVRVYIEGASGTNPCPTSTTNSTQGLLKVERWFNPSETYISVPVAQQTSTYCNTPTAVQRLGYLSTEDTPTVACSGVQKPKIFRFYDAQGIELLPTNTATCGLTVQQLQRLALVVVDAKVSYRDQDDPTGRSSIPLKAAVSIQSSAYAKSEVVR